PVYRPVNKLNKETPSYTSCINFCIILMNIIDIKLLIIAPIAIYNITMNITVETVSLKFGSIKLSIK
ncbi:MAG: hypothetical protein E6021_12935, partial [Staphylococcus epidermidis]|nr:hypothetical protein [Staphylococcus epidermidis]